MENLRLLFLGDVVGEPGRKAVIHHLPRLRKELALDFIVVNGENAAGGRGITPKIAIDLLRAGAAVITTGDHVWDQSEIVDYLPTEPRLLRPINYPGEVPGAGSVVLDTAKGPVAVLQGQGRTFMQPPLDNPFLALEERIAALREDGVRMILVDIHAETTSEKIALGWALDGLASVVVGTHTHVQTADERILPGGTGCLTDAGMCGPDDSVLGRARDSVVWRFRTGMPTRFPVAKGAVRLCGLVAELETDSGRCVSIERFNRRIEREELLEASATSPSEEPSKPQNP